MINYMKFCLFFLRPAVHSYRPFCPNSLIFALLMTTKPLLDFPKPTFNMAFLCTLLSFHVQLGCSPTIAITQHGKPPANLFFTSMAADVNKNQRLAVRLSALLCSITHMV